MGTASFYSTSIGALSILNSSGYGPLWKPRLNGPFRVGIFLCAHWSNDFIRRVCKELICEKASVINFYGVYARKAEDIADDLRVNVFDETDEQYTITTSVDGEFVDQDIIMMFSLANSKIVSDAGFIIYVFDEPEPRGKVEERIRRVMGFPPPHLVITV